MDYGGSGVVVRLMMKQSNTKYIKTMNKRMYQIAKEGRWVAIVSDKSQKMRKGKALVNAKDKELIFMEYASEGARSREVGRTAHGRMRRKPDGTYGLNFKFRIDERSLKESLISEMRSLLRTEIRARMGIYTKTITD